MASEETDSTSLEGLFNEFDPKIAANPQGRLRAMLERSPIERTGDGSVRISGRDEAKFAFRHTEIFSSADAINIGNKVPLIPLMVDPPLQTKYRKLVDPLFSRKRMNELEPSMRELAVQFIDRFADKGECEFNSAFAIPFPCIAFLRLMGLPLDDLDFFLELKDGIIRPEVGDMEDRQTKMNATGERIHAYFDTAIDERLARRDDGLLSHFLDTEIDGEKLSRDEIQGICYLFLLAGLDTVTAALGCSMSYLAQHPEQRQRIVDDPSLIPSAVEELLRWESPVGGVPRLVVQDAEVAGVKLHKGDRVGIGIASANIDARGFPEPDNVDFNRRPNPHFAFGGGAHRCLGSHLARLELRVAMDEFHKRIPVYSIKPGETLRYSTGIRQVDYLPLVFGT